MADKDLKIQITTVADTSGADAAAASLKKVEAAGQAADGKGGSMDISDLNAKLENMKARAAAITEQAAATEELGNKTEEAASKGRRLGEITAAVGAIGMAAKISGAYMDSLVKEVNKVDFARLQRIDPKLAEDFKGVAMWAKIAEEPVAALFEIIQKMSSGTTAGQQLKDMQREFEAPGRAKESVFNAMIETGTTQVGEIGKLVDGIAQANKLLDAQDKTAEAERRR
ncbi:MAG: hypothetical protein WCL29_03130, partial [Pseudomonadota bacterium]